MANQFNEEETAYGIPEEIFPLWFSNVTDFEVVKSHTRIVYRVHADGMTCFLKVHPESEQRDSHPLDRTRFDRSSDFACHLADAGVPIARPVASRHNNSVEVQTFSDVTMVVQVSSEVSGTEVSAACRDTSVYERCGIALAQFHTAAESYRLASQFDDQAWEREWEETKSKMDGDNPILAKEYAKINDWLETSLPLAGGKGLTHGDTNILNFIDNGKQVSLIDIDSPMHTWYAIDLSHPFSHNQVGLISKDRFLLYSAFIAGYRSLRPTDLEYETIRWLMRHWMLVTYVAYAAMPNPEEKAYLKRWYSFVEHPEQW